jgi:hypothetical protein
MTPDVKGDERIEPLYTALQGYLHWLVHAPQQVIRSGVVELPLIRFDERERVQRVLPRLR